MKPTQLGKLFGLQAGVRFGLFEIFAQTMYPKDEPALPSSTHIRRALGGPIINHHSFCYTSIVA